METKNTTSNYVGALWKSKTKNGEPMLSLQIEIDGVKHKFVAFKNKFKEEDKHPDYKILIPQNKNNDDAF